MLITSTSGSSGDLVRFCQEPHDAESERMLEGLRLRDETEDRG